MERTRKKSPKVKYLWSIIQPDNEVKDYLLVVRRLCDVHIISEQQSFNHTTI